MPASFLLVAISGIGLMAHGPLFHRTALFPHKVSRVVERVSGIHTRECIYMHVIEFPPLNKVVIETLEVH